MMYKEIYQQEHGFNCSTSSCSYFLILWIYAFDKTWTRSLRGHPFNTRAKYCKILTFVTLWYVHVCVRFRRGGGEGGGGGVENVSFSGNFAHVLNGWPLADKIAEFNHLYPINNKTFWFNAHAFAVPVNFFNYTLSFT